MVQARYLQLTALLLSATVATAHAQTGPSAMGDPPAGAPAGSDPYRGTSADPSPSGTLTTSDNLPPPGDPTLSPAPAPAFTANPALPIRSVVPPLSPLVQHRYRTGRIVYGVGTAVSFIGSSLTLASVIVSAVYGLGLDPSSDKITGRIGPGLAYGGASATGAGFVMVATGLGLQHSALAVVGQDPGRGLYGTGTAFGILGLCGIGTSYFFGLTRLGGEDATVIAFGASVAAGTLLTIGSILYWTDAARVRQVYRRLTTF